MRNPPRIGLTGGIATGKSTFATLFALRLNADFFCADSCVRDLLDHDSGVAREIREHVHPEACGPDGSPDRGFLRRLVFGDEAARRALENVLHPKVRAAWTRLAGEALQQGRPFLADIPLLFETGAASLFDAVVTVACSPEIQRERLLGRRGIDASIAKKMIASQWPIDSKIEASTHVVWNDGDLDALCTQSDFLARLFDDRSG